MQLIVTPLFLLLVLSLSGNWLNLDFSRQSKPKFELEANKLKLPKPIVFKTGSDEILSESNDALQHVKAFLDEKSYVSILRIEAHSDQVANDQTLTEKRALAVAKWLIANGVDCKRILPVGFGSTKPIADSKTPEGKAQNRRIDFVVAELRGRAIAGMPLDGGGKVAGEPCKIGTAK